MRRTLVADRSRDRREATPSEQLAHRRHPPARRRPRPRGCATLVAELLERRRPARRPRHLLLPRRPRHSRPAAPVVHASHLDFPIDGPHGRDRRRRALHRPHRARRDRGAVRLRPPRAACSSPCSPTAATASCRSAPTTSARTCRPRAASASTCASRSSTAWTRSRSAEPRRRSRRAHEAASALHRRPRPGGHRAHPRPRRVASRRSPAARSRRSRRCAAGRWSTSSTRPRTRTSTSFELAAKRLSADVVNFVGSGSSVDKGESLKDTVQTLSAYDPAAIVIRSPARRRRRAGRAAGPTRGRQRGRRQARAPDPGAARRLHAARAASGALDGKNDLDRRRRPALARRALEHRSPSQRMGARSPSAARRR